MSDSTPLSDLMPFDKVFFNARVFQALEYAKNIPKPKMVPRSADASSTAKGSSLATESVVPGASDAGFEELQRLKERHQFERQQVALLLHNNGY